MSHTPAQVRGRRAVLLMVVFAQGLASCWLPGVRSAHEFPSTSFWESLTGSGRGPVLCGSVVAAPLPCLSLGQHWQVKHKLLP